jgi:hypothetical protein
MATEMQPTIAEGKVLAINGGFGLMANGSIVHFPLEQSFMQANFDGISTRGVQYFVLIFFRQQMTKLAFMSLIGK